MPTRRSTKSEVGEGAEPVSADVLRELRAWGGPAEMSAFETVMWRAEIDPRLRSTTTSILILDRSPDWQQLYDHHRWLVAVTPRFRQRVVDPAFGPGAPTWVEDPEFNLDYHLRHVRLPAPGSERQLFDIGQNIAMTPFDKARSPWEATLVDGLEGERAAYILKLHHATSDGLGIMQLLSRTLESRRTSRARPVPSRVDSGARRPPTASALALAQLRKGLLSLPEQVGSTALASGRALQRLANGPDSARRGTDYLASARRVLATKPVAGSGILRRRSLSWRFDSIEIPLPALKSAAKSVDATLNDAFLSGLIGGFRRYHEEMGVRIESMPIGFPISIRRDDDPMGGNKFAGSQYAAPVSEPDPVARIRHIQAFVKRTRAEPALDFMVRLMPIMARLPMPVVIALTADFTSAQDAQISNIPGIAHPVFLAGSRVTHFWPFAPVPGCGMMIAMVSHDGRCCIGINSDRAAVTEPDLLVECLRAGLEEVLALGATATDTGRVPA